MRNSFVIIFALLFVNCADSKQDWNYPDLTPERRAELEQELLTLESNHIPITQEVFENNGVREFFYHFMRFEENELNCLDRTIDTFNVEFISQEEANDLCLGEQACYIEWYHTAYITDNQELDLFLDNLTHEIGHFYDAISTDEFFSMTFENLMHFRLYEFSSEIGSNSVLYTFGHYGRGPSDQFVAASIDTLFLLIENEGDIEATFCAMLNSNEESLNNDFAERITSCGYVSMRELSEILWNEILYDSSIYSNLFLFVGKEEGNRFLDLVRFYNDIRL